MVIALDIDVIIRFVSTLSKEAEEAAANALIDAAVQVLDLLPIGYSITIELQTGEMLTYSRPYHMARGTRQAPKPTRQAS